MDENSSKVSSVSQYIEQGKTESEYWTDIVTGKIISKEKYDEIKEQEKKEAEDKQEEKSEIIYYICTKK